MSDTSLQDVSFAPEDDLEMTKRKLRIMQEEVLRLAAAMSQTVGLNQENAIDLRNPLVDAGAAVPAAAAYFVHATINGQPVLLAAYPP